MDAFSNVVIVGHSKDARKLIMCNINDHCTIQEFSSIKEMKLALYENSKYIMLIEGQCVAKSIIGDLDKNVRNALQLLIIYGESFESDDVREWFLQGVDDVQKTEDISWKSITSLYDLKLKNQCTIEFSGNDYASAIRRGALIEQSLAGGSLPVYYMNTNRIEYLRADIASFDDSSSSWHHIAVTEWLNEFGKNNAFIYLKPNSYQGLRLGALVDIDEENRLIFRNKLSTRLDRFFAAIKRINCISSASSCNAEYLDYSVASFLDHQNEMIFFLNNSCYITSSQNKEIASSDNDMLKKFGEAIANEDTSLAASYINQMVDILCKESTSPSYAYVRLSSFARIISVMKKTDEFGYSLNPYRARNIFALRDQLLNLITRAKLTPNQYEELNKKGNDKINIIINDIKRNPTLDYSAEKTATLLGYSRSHFCRIFSKLAGESFGTFVRKEKLKYGAELLQQTSFSINEIGTFIGYPNTWYFRKAFELQYGMPPETFRENKLSSSIRIP